MTDPQAYAGAFEQLARTLAFIFGSPDRGEIIAALFFLLFVAYVIRRMRACERGHRACIKSERNKMIAIAHLNAVVCTMAEHLPADHPARDVLSREAADARRTDERARAGGVTRRRPSPEMADLQERIAPLEARRKRRGAICRVGDDEGGRHRRR